MAEKCRIAEHFIDKKYGNVIIKTIKLKEEILMLKNRNIVTVILLSVVTCGIYSLYWTYVTMDALDQEGQSSNMPVIAQFILCFFYVGFLLFGLNAEANLNAIKAKKGMPAADNKILWMVLGLLVPIVLVVLVQLEINKLCPEA